LLQKAEETRMLKCKHLYLLIKRTEKVKKKILQVYLLGKLGSLLRIDTIELKGMTHIPPYDQVLIYLLGSG
jgi:hypothetical protein